LLGVAKTAAVVGLVAASRFDGESKGIGLAAIAAVVKNLYENVDEFITNTVPGARTERDRTDFNGGYKNYSMFKGNLPDPTLVPGEIKPKRDSGVGNALGIIPAWAQPDEVKGGRGRPATNPEFFANRKAEEERKLGSIEKGEPEKGRFNGLLDRLESLLGLTSTSSSPVVKDQMGSMKAPVPILASPKLSPVHDIINFKRTVSYMNTPSGLKPVMKPESSVAPGLNPVMKPESSVAPGLNPVMKPESNTPTNLNPSVKSSTPAFKIPFFVTPPNSSLTNPRGLSPITEHGSTEASVRFDSIEAAKNSLDQTYSTLKRILIQTENAYDLRSNLGAQFDRQMQVSKSINTSNRLGAATREIRQEKSGSGAVIIAPKTVTNT
jgi:hypothetical protein